MKILVTHNGRAHIDDFLSACLVMHKEGVNVVRKTWPTDEELADPEIMVADFGAKLEPHLRNFDHHQIKGGAVCAFTLILEHYGMRDYESLPWIKVVETHDHCGPSEAIKVFGGGSNSQDFLYSPIEKTMLEIFSKTDVVVQGSSFGILMTQIGKLIEDNYLSYHAHKKELTEKVEILNYRGYVVADFTKVERVLSPLADINFCRDSNVNIVLSRNDRGEAKLRMTRKNDRIDFNLAKSLPNVSFVHQNGFLIVFNGDFKEILDLV
jgi:hypothetical protein